MTNGITDAALDDLLRTADPLRSPPPSEAEIEAALRRVTEARPRARRARGHRAPVARRSRVLASVVAAAGVVAAALGLVLGGATSSPAFAVSRNANGTVSVTLLRHSTITPAEIAALNHALDAMNAGTTIVQRASGVMVRCPDGLPARGLTIRPTRMLILPTDRAGHLAYPAAARDALAAARRFARAERAGHDPGPTVTARDARNAPPGSADTGRMHNPAAVVSWNCGRDRAAP
jgi:hypothetical protein